MGDYSNKKLSSFPLRDIQEFLRKTGPDDKVLLRLRDNQLTQIPRDICLFTKIATLELQRNALTALPDDIYRLGNLCFVNIEQNRLLALPESLGRLTLLKYLNIRDNQVGRMPEFVNSASLETLLLCRNQLTTLPASLLTRARYLKTLYITSNRLTLLPDCISSLRSLDVLALSENELRSLPPSLGRCHRMRTLLANLNQLTHVPSSIGKLSRLQLLHLGANRIRALPNTIGQLTSLQSLDISSNSLVALPADLARLTQLNEKSINIALNDLVSPPSAVIKSGQWLDYLRDTLAQASECFRVKIMLVGKENVGKTSLLKCLQGKKKKERNLSTDGIDICQIDVSSTADNRNIRLNVWDFAGQEIYYTTHQIFLSERAVYVLVWDVRKSFAECRLEFWLNTIRVRVGDNAIVMLVATHLDDSICTDDYVNSKLILLSKTYGPRFASVKAYMALSTLTDEGMPEFREKLLQLAMQVDGMGQTVPTAYLALEDMMTKRLRSLTSDEHAPVVSFRKWQRLALDISLTDVNVLKRATEFLHNVGSLIYFGNDEKLVDLVIVDPQWLTNCMATIITTKHQAVVNGILSANFLPQLWLPPQYPVPIHPQLIQLMMQFEVMHPLGDDLSVAQFNVTTPPQYANYLVVSLLPEERPEKVERLFPSVSLKDAANAFSRIYTFTFLPPGLFSRMLLRCSAFATLDVYWRHGMLCTGDNNNRMLVECLNNRIRVRVRGEGSAALLRQATEILDSLTANWYKMEHTIEIECVHCLMSGSNDEPYLFLLDDCERAAAAGEGHILCGGSFPVRLDRLVPDLTMSDFVGCRLEVEDLQFEATIGKGAFGDIYRGNYFGRPVAIKQLRVSVDNSTAKYNDFRKEVWFMSGLDHQNIVNLIGYTVKPLCMVMELVEGGDLYAYLHNDALSGQMGWPLRIKMTFEIARGMRYLHSSTPPFIHRDLKTPNILLVSHDVRAPDICKITDFGLASRLYIEKLKENVKERAVSNPTWVAPEILKEDSFTLESDVYSYGLIVWELLTREHPFAEFEFKFMTQLEDSVKQGVRPTIPSWTPPVFKQLIEALWHQDPTQRPTFADACEIVSQIAAQMAPDLRFTEDSRDHWQPRAHRHSTSSTSLASLGGTARSTVNGDLLRQIVPDPPLLLDCMVYVESVEQVWGGCKDDIIAVWSAENGDELTRVKGGHGSAVNALAQVGSNVWSGGGDGSICMWAATRRRKMRARHHAAVNKKASGALGWNRRYLLLEGTTVFVYKNEKQFENEPDAGKPQSLESCQLTASKKAQWFQISPPAPAKPMQFQCKDKDELSQWLALISAAIRNATVSVATCLRKVEWRKLKNTVNYTLLPIEYARALGRVQGQSLKSNNQITTPIRDMRRPANLSQLRFSDSHVNHFVMVDTEVWSCSMDLVLRVWDGATFHLKNSLVIDIGSLVPRDKAFIWNMLSYKGKVWCAVNQFILRIDLRERVLVDYLVGHKALVNDMVGYRNQVWSCSSDHTMRVWSAISGECLRRLDCSDKLFCILNTGPHMWVAGVDQQILMWDADKYTCVKKLPPNKESTTCMILVWKKTVWAGSWDNLIKIWT